MCLIMSLHVGKVLAWKPEGLDVRLVGLGITVLFRLSFTPCYTLHTLFTGANVHY